MNDRETNSKPRGTSRRNFVKSVAGAGIGYWIAPSRARAESQSPNEKLNLGIVGVHNRAADNLNGVSSQNIVVLCDVDDGFLAGAKEKFPKADAVHDWRKLVDRNDLDGVVVSTPDHCHAIVTVNALRSGKHVYCEKPLTHDVYEARLVTDTAREMKRVTQLGTQIHALDNYRRVVELIQAGAIGPVREVHVWCGKSWGGGDRPTDTPPVPATLNWDLWLGPAPERPYHPSYHPFHWRKWWDFGGGTLADMGCHYIDVVFWALGLTYPTRVEAKADQPAHAETAAVALEVAYEFPAHGNRPPVKLNWYDGGKRPTHFKTEKLPEIGDGVLFIGDKGMLMTNYSVHHLLPEERFADYQRPEPTIPKSIGHHEEWIDACKTGKLTTCHFGYSGPLTETVLLGVVAYRAGEALEWDAGNLRAKNSSAANNFIRREYRKGWAL